MTPKGTNGQLQVAAQVAAKRTRASRSPHPGVVLVKPRDGHPTWRARCEDPDTGKRVFVRLDPTGAGRNAQTRRQWAMQKAQSIARRKDELASGAPRARGTSLEAAIEAYFKAREGRLRDWTEKTYRKATAKLLIWANAQGIRSADELTLAHVTKFRDWLSAEPKRVAVARGKRGSKRLGTPRSASAANVDIRSIKVVLNALRRSGDCARLSRDDIADGLKVLAVEREAPVFLRSPEIKALLVAAVAYDRASHLESNLRDWPIAPLVAAALLSGMRYGELLALDWSEVDLGEGEIRLSAKTKTKRARALDLGVSPSLVALLEALRKDAGGPSSGRVFVATEGQIKAGARRLISSHGAPEFTWQVLRRTCGTFLTNSRIYGGASAYRSARQLGHSVTVAENHYLGVVKVPKDAATLEAAMGVETEVAEVLARIRSGVS